MLHHCKIYPSSKQISNVNQAISDDRSEQGICLWDHCVVLALRMQLEELGDALY